MKKSSLWSLLLAWLVTLVTAGAAVVTVTTTDNINPGAGQKSFKQALAAAQDGDTIAFNIPGAGPHYILTPPDGYPWITNNNVTIDGYSQPGSAPNTNSILAPNSAKLKIVLDSRNGNFVSMNYEPANSNAGYGDSEFAVLGVFRATNVTLRGLCVLGKVPVAGDPSNYGLSWARDYNGTASGGHISGCWIGVDPDGKTLSGTAYAITAFRHRDPDGNNPVTIDDLTIGVKKDSTVPRAEFNVMVQSAIPIIVESQGARICGNFLGVMPDGVTEYNVAFDPAYTGDFQYEGAIEVGRDGNNTVIGVDGDGVNDAEERNIICGTVPPALNGYDHTIEFYGNNPGTNIVVAGNYIGIGIDGTTRFTNGVPAFNASGGSPQYRFGSDLDGVSDDLEANVIYNYWPPDKFPATDLANRVPNDLNMFDELSLGAMLSARGNRFVNDLPFPASPTKQDGGVDGAWLTNYYAKALTNANEGIRVVLNTNLTSTRRLVGTVPIAETNNYPYTILDLYAANPESRQLGRDSLIPEFSTNGFVLGDSYLGSLVVGSTNNHNPNPGQFDFDLSKLGLHGGFKLTVTANYSMDPPGAHNARVLTSPFADPLNLPLALKIDRISIVTGGKIQIDWTGTGTLQSTPVLPASPTSWTDVSGSSGVQLTPPATGNIFYRLKQ
jgi:hypothetical protein